VKKPSILLADDNPAILTRVGDLLDVDDRYELVAAVTNGAAALHEYSRLKPDVVVLDISMQVVSGIDVAQDLRDGGCNSKIVFLTVHEDCDFVNAAMGAGGSGYVLKSRLSTDLIPAINAALSNKLFVSPSLLYARH